VETFNEKSEGAKGKGVTTSLRGCVGAICIGEEGKEDTGGVEFEENLERMTWVAIFIMGERI